MEYSIKKYQEFFDQYANHFIEIEKEPANKTLIAYKLHHTYRVRDNIVRIATSCHLDERGMFIAEMIGLFHDIARFEQFYRFQSYDDRKTVNHGLYGKEVLMKEQVLQELEPKLQQLIWDCVAYHNVPSLPKDLDPELYYFTSMLRDADKIDIIKAMADIVPTMSPEEQDLWYLGRSRKNCISDKVYQNFMEQRVSLISDCTTVVDSQFSRLAWVFVDMNFRESIKMIEEGQYVDTIYEMSGKDLKMTEMYHYIKACMKKYIEQGRESYLG